MLTERELEIRDVKDAINIIKDYCIDCGDCENCDDDIKEWCSYSACSPNEWGVRYKR